VLTGYQPCERLVRFFSLVYFLSYFSHAYFTFSKHTSSVLNMLLPPSSKETHGLFSHFQCSQIFSDSLSSLIWIYQHDTTCPLCSLLLQVKRDSVSSFVFYILFFLLLIDGYNWYSLFVIFKFSIYCWLLIFKFV
jgi:hypothetical protein